LARIRAVVARACATVSGMSFGEAQAPAMNTPSVVVDTGSSFGWLSMNHPSLSRLMFTRRATLAESSRASMPTIRTTMSAGISTSSPESISFSRTSMLQPSSFRAGTTVGGLCLSYIMKTDWRSELRR
jgi:hypothetical protein